MGRLLSSMAIRFNQYKTGTKNVYMFDFKANGVSRIPWDPLKLTSCSGFSQEAVSPYFQSSAKFSTSFQTLEKLF